ncbi:MAG: M3 family oligoendopeptidase, partial [Spirochaetota bacterium]
MNFNDFEYVKPDFEKYKLKFDQLINDMNNADDFSSFDKAINEIINLRKEYETMQTISSIRYSINTLDKFYEEQQNYFDSISPYYEGILNKISKLILESKYLKEIENKYGKQIIVLLESAIKTFDEIILSDMQQENNLKTEYRKLTSQAKINFEGKEYTLSQMSYFM